MKNPIKSYIDRIVSSQVKKHVVTNVTKRKGSNSKKGTQEADLFRETFTIQDWQEAVDQAEDVEFPDRIELARLYKNLIDDDTIWQNMQIRIARSVTGKLKIKDGEGNDVLEDVFFKPDGNPKKWFRDWIKLQVKAKFYGAVLMNFSDIINNEFSWVKMVDYQNVIPEKNKIIRNTDYGLWGNDANLIDFTKPPISDWCYLVDDGDPRSLGLLNKCAPYYIWKNDASGNWAMFLDIYGVDIILGKTDTTDPARAEQMDDGLANAQSGRWFRVHTDDEVEALSSSQSNAGDTFNDPIKYYDKAISKIVLGQTSLSEDKSFVGSAEIQERAGNDIILMDKIDIADNFENQLIPFMIKHGMIADDDYYLIWDIDEKLSKLEWAEVIQKISAKADIPAEEIERIFGIEVSEQATDKDMIEVANNVYKSIINGTD